MEINEYLRNKMILTQNKTRKEIDAAYKDGKEIVLVYQMGKVGSTSFATSLDKISKLKVFHVHRMNEDENNFMINHYLSSGNYKYVLREYRWMTILKNTIGSGRKVNIITAFRDPIARNISAFFQNISKEDLKHKTTEELFGQFLRKYNHKLPLKWFDNEFQISTGINVLDYPFDKEAGWGVIDLENKHCLILTAETDDDNKEKAISGFLKLEGFRLKRENSAKTKEYAKQYKDFLKIAKFNDDFLDGFYSSKIVNHFYAKQKIKEFRDRWSYDKRLCIEGENASNLKRNEDKKVSILLSCYNGSELIEEYINSLLTQEIIDNCTLIAVNFPFSHKNPEWVKKQLNRYPDLVLIDCEDDLSLYDAWNTAIRAAKTEFVSNLNLDDRVSSDYYIYGIEKLKEMNADVFSSFSTMTSVIGKKSADAKKQIHIELERFGDNEVIEYGKADLVMVEGGRIVKRNIPHCAPIWKRSIHEELGFFDSHKFDFCADYEFWLRAASAGKKLIVSKKEKVLFYCAKGTASDRILHPENKKIIDHWKSTFPPPGYRPTQLGKEHDLLHYCMNMNVIFSSSRYYSHLENNKEFQKLKRNIQEKYVQSVNENIYENKGLSEQSSNEYDFKDRYNRLRQFKDIHKGERCILICNGPSLNQVDFSRIDKDKFVFFGLNKIYLGFDHLGFYPHYVVAINKKVIEQAANEYNKLPITKFIGSRVDEQLVPEGPQTFRINTTNLPKPHRRFSTDISEYVHEGWTVTHAALQIIYYMGFSEVYIVGMDHRFSQHVKGQENKESVIKGTDVDHFHPSYFGNGQTWDYPDLTNSEISYKEALNAFLKDGRKIFDCTIGGACTIFPKMDIESLYMLANKEKPKVSIIMPVYNAEPYLNKAIESIQAQEVQDWELLIIEDGSEDDSLNTAKNYASKDSRIRLLRNQGKGVSSARNYGLDLARGRYITFLDADDFYYDKALSGRINLLESDSKKHVSFVSTEIVDEHGIPLDWTTGKQKRVTFEDQCQGTLQITSPMIRASVIGTLRFDEELPNGEDWLFLTQLSVRVEAFYKAKEGAVAYRLHSDSTVKKDFYEHERNIRNVIDRIYRIKEDIEASSPERFKKTLPDKEDIKRRRMFNVFTWSILDKNNDQINKIIQDKDFYNFLKDKSNRREMENRFITTTMRYYVCSRNKVPSLLYNKKVLELIEKLGFEDRFQLFYDVVLSCMGRQENMISGNSKYLNSSKNLLSSKKYNIFKGNKFAFYFIKNQRALARVGKLVKWSYKTLKRNFWGIGGLSLLLITLFFGSAILVQDYRWFLVGSGAILMICLMAGLTLSYGEKMFYRFYSAQRRQIQIYIDNIKQNMEQTIKDLQEQLEQYEEKLNGIAAYNEEQIANNVKDLQEQLEQYEEKLNGIAAYNEEQIANNVKDLQEQLEQYEERLNGIAAHSKEQIANIQSGVKEIKNYQEKLNTNINKERSERILSFAYRDSLGELPHKYLILVALHRCGSTWLLDAIRAHPDVYIEPRTFLNEYTSVNNFNRYPNDLCDGHDAELDIEIAPGKGSKIPALGAQKPTSIAGQISTDAYAIEKIHPEFINFITETFLSNIESLETKKGTSFKFIYQIRDPKAIISSFLNYKKRNPKWYKHIAEKDVPKFVYDELKAISEFSRLRDGIVVDYDNLLIDFEATIKKIFSCLWPQADKKAIRDIALYAKTVTDRTKRKNVVPTSFFGEVNGNDKDHRDFFEEHQELIARCYEIYNILKQKSI